MRLGIRPCVFSDFSLDHLVNASLCCTEPQHKLCASSHALCTLVPFIKEIDWVLYWWIR